MTSSLINDSGGEFESIFILGYDNDDFKKSFLLNCEEDNDDSEPCVVPIDDPCEEDDDDSEPCVVPIDDPLREPLCIELISDIEDDDVCIINDDASITFVSGEKACGEPSLARNLKNNVVKDVVCSEKKVNTNKKMTNNDLKKVNESGQCNYSNKQKTPKKKFRKVSYCKHKKQFSSAEATSEVSDFSEEEKFHKTSDNFKLITDKNLKAKRSGQSCIGSTKSKKKEIKKPLQKSSTTSVDSSVNSESDMVLDNNSFKQSDVFSVPESRTTGNTSGDTNNDNISTFMANDIMLLAWELEIKRQEELRKSSGRSRVKYRSCDCRLVFKTLSDDHSYETKRRVNYLTKYTCCEFRKTVLGHVYYVPVIATETESSSKNKRPNRKGKSKLNKKLGISVQDEFKNTGEDCDDSKADDTCFDNLIESEIQYLMNSQPNNDNGYYSNSESSKG